ncbi:MAG: hypothetical protein JWN89_308 [Parcubacteria group bacterium]|nr:hypothetical protein [Parcubacteria group bacterium]
MMRTLSHIAATICLLLLFGMPILVLGAPPCSGPNCLIPCDGPECGFDHLVQLGIAIINNLIIYATILTVAVLAYAGFTLVTSGGDEGALKKAKGMFWSVVKGYVWILIAWILVYTVMNALVDPSYNSVLGKP